MLKCYTCKTPINPATDCYQTLEAHRCPADAAKATGPTKQVYCSGECVLADLTVGFMVHLGQQARNYEHRN